MFAILSIVAGDELVIVYGNSDELVIRIRNTC